MAKFIFGKTVSYLFSPLIDDTQTSVSTLVSARIYKDSPTSTQIDNLASGHIEEKTTWTNNGDNTYTISFSPLIDDDAHSGSPYESYYVAINYKYEVTAPTVFEVKSIRIYRPTSWTERIVIVPQDLIDIENKLSIAFSNPTTTLTAHIADAIEEVLARFEALGFSKSKFVDIDKLNRYVKYKACEFACRNAASDDGQFWFAKATFYNDECNNIFNQTTINYRSDDLGQNEAISKIKNITTMWLAR
jgi:hypothetical protein